ncbi:MAG: hypothetical protein C0469_12185 [Cyanobacteria bacterium DS2.3.42]|nr:hypothetical protein [Cyanobacteria bacterium DS2.3.42]
MTKNAFALCLGFCLLAVFMPLFFCATATNGQVQEVLPSKKAVVKTPTLVAKKSAKLLDGLLIKHYSWLGGEVEIAVTPEFLCISCPTRSDVTVSRAPFKTVVAYDSSKRTFYETKPEAAGSFMIQRFLKLLGGDPHPKKWKKVEDGVIAGVKAGRYVVDETGMPPHKYSYEKGEKLITDMRVLGFWVAEDLNIPPGAADIVLKMEGFPTIHKLPLKFQKALPEPGAKPKVVTYSVQKAKFSPEKFQVPSGYHKQKAEFSLQSEELELFGGGDPASFRKGGK